MNLSTVRAAMSRPAVLRTLSAAIPAIALTGTVHAWIGNFEAADGYQPFLNFVQNYNAGQYGANSGYVGPGPVAIPSNTGLWTAVNGGFFSGGAVSYATGHQGFDRAWINNSVGNSSNQGLVYTTGHEGWNGPALKYRYQFDSQDFGGNNPADPSLEEVKLSFWNYGQLAGPEANGQVPEGYFGNEIAFTDGSGNVAFSLGLTQRAAGDRITYWNGSSLVESALQASFGGTRYDRWDITFNLITDTVSATLFRFEDSTSYPLVVNAPFQSAASGITHMTLRSSPGVNNAKLAAIDDFTVTSRIPTPSAGALLALAGVVASRRRRA